jgi:hypothetical protein
MYVHNAFICIAHTYIHTYIHNTNPLAGNARQRDIQVRQRRYIHACMHTYIIQTRLQEMHGKGTFKYANGDTYMGQYFGGRHQGHGEFIWANGDKYVGEVGSRRHEDINLCIRVYTHVYTYTYMCVHTYVVYAHILV